MRTIASFAVCMLAGTMSVALGQPSKLVVSGPGLTVPMALENQRVPVWRGNGLVVTEGLIGEPNAFRVYDAAGTVIFQAPFSIADASHTFVRNITRGPDGTVALCGSAYAGDGRGAPFIAWISSDGDSHQVIRTEPYTPNLVTVAQDGTLWTIGYELNANGSEKSGVNLDAGVLRHFDRSGKLLGAFLPRSGFTDPTEFGQTSGYLLSAAGRIGWFHYRVYPENNGVGAYVEILPDGSMAQYPLPQISGLKTALIVDGMAMTDAGDVYVSVRDLGAHNAFSILWLNRSTKQWLRVPLYPGVSGDFALLYGASGSTLVMRLPSDSPSQVHFYKPAS